MPRRRLQRLERWRRLDDRDRTWPDRVGSRSRDTGAEHGERRVRRRYDTGHHRQRLGKTVSDIAHTTEGDVKQAAIKDAVTAHHDAVTEAAQQHGDGASDGSGTDANGSSSHDNNGGGNSEIARGHGADVSALAHETDGAKGSVVSAFANTHGDIVSAAAKLNSGFAADNDADDVSPTLDPTGIQLTA